MECHDKYDKTLNGDEMKKIILVANSDVVIDINQMIDEHDIIVRFNHPKKFSLVKTGERTDILFLSNTVNLMEGRIRRGRHKEKHISNQTKVIFSYADSLIQKINPYYTKKPILPFLKHIEKCQNWNNHKYINIFNNLNVQVEIISEDSYWNIYEITKIERNHILSTGFIALHYFLSHPEYADYKIYLNGFTSEGWQGHDWLGEKKYIADLIDRQTIYYFK